MMEVPLHPPPCIDHSSSFARTALSSSCLALTFPSSSTLARSTSCAMWCRFEKTHMHRLICGGTEETTTKGSGTAYWQCVSVSALLLLLREPTCMSGVRIPRNMTLDTDV